MGNKFWRILIVSVCIICFAALGMAFAQKKVGGGDIKYEGKTQGAVVFSHETHVNKHKAKCAECHPKDSSRRRRKRRLPRLIIASRSIARPATTARRPLA